MWLLKFIELRIDHDKAHGQSATRQLRSNRTLVNISLLGILHHDNSVHRAGTGHIGATRASRFSSKAVAALQAV
jgi:hypothetical protein